MASLALHFRKFQLKAQFQYGTIAATFSQFSIKSDDLVFTYHNLGLMPGITSTEYIASNVKKNNLATSNLPVHWKLKYNFAFMIMVSIAFYQTNICAR